MARIGKYREWLEEDKLILLEGWARRGLTDEQIAHNMGITVKTLYEWKNKYSEFSDALKKGKEVVDIIVENALLKRALGYDVEEWSEQSGTRRRHIPPDTTAQIFWLKNRRPDLWRDKPAETVTEEVESDNFIEALNNVSENINAPDDSDMLPQEDA